MPRFVILTHDWPFPHYDLMLESGGSLRTWRMDMAPGDLKPPSILAESLGDHRLVYLDYEGPVSGNRGLVRRWDFGTFAWDIDMPGEIRVQLMGNRVVGTVKLMRTEGNLWALHFEPESAAR